MKLVFLTLALIAGTALAGPKLSKEDQANAKANALQAYLAQGEPMKSNPRLANKSRRYTKGSIKNLTKEEAVARFNRLWAQTPEAAKVRWAKMGPPVKEDTSADEAANRQSARNEANRKLRQIQRQVEELERQSR